MPDRKLPRKRLAGIAVILRLDLTAFIGLDRPRLHPCFAGARQPLRDIDLRIRLRIRPRAVIDTDRRLICRLVKRDFAQGHSSSHPPKRKLFSNR